MQEWLSKYLLNHEDFKKRVVACIFNFKFRSSTTSYYEENGKFGAPKDVTSFVIPIGYSFNLDGSALYQSIAALFVAQMFDIHLSLTQQIVLMATLMIASKGMAGVPGVSIVVLLTTLGSMHLPAQGLALIIGIDRLLDMVRTCVNVMGNALSTIVISKWENVYDKEKGQEYLKTL